MNIAPLLNKPVMVTVEKNGFKFFRTGTLVSVRHGNKSFGRVEGLVKFPGEGKAWFNAVKIGRA